MLASEYENMGASKRLARLMAERDKLLAIGAPLPADLLTDLAHAMRYDVRVHYARRGWQPLKVNMAMDMEN